MPDRISIRIDGRDVPVTDGISVAAAVVAAGVTSFRRSVTGQPRGPLCGMGICFECRATVDGVAQRRTCQLIVRDGMEIKTDGGG
jgi:D-hydroxyproline dehydrogenase subunit gamma